MVGREIMPGQPGVQVIQLCPKVLAQGAHGIYSSSLLPGLTGGPRKQSINHSKLKKTIQAHARRAAPRPAVSVCGGLILAHEDGVGGRKGNREKVAGGQKAAAKEIAIRMQKQPQIWHHRRFTVCTHLPLCSQCTRSFFLSIYIQ